jgi:hypothetical protein
MQTPNRRKRKIPLTPTLSQREREKRGEREQWRRRKIEKENKLPLSHRERGPG